MKVDQNSGVRKVQLLSKDSSLLKQDLSSYLIDNDTDLSSVDNQFNLTSKFDGEFEVLESDLSKLKVLKLNDIWSVALKFFQIEKLLGFGSYGQVVLATCKFSRRQVAIKFIQGIFKNEYDCVKVLREISI
jgi:hypothetical protein